MIYFDHNATSPLIPAAREAWLRAVDEFVGNPSSPHRVGNRAETALDDARGRLARLIGCDPSDLVWTSGATEANNQIFHHLARVLPADAEIWVSAIEHPSVVEAALHYFGSRLCRIPADRTGVIDLEWLSTQLSRRRPAAVAVMAANNVTGVLQPWQRVAELCRRHGVISICDAVQWVGRMPSAELGMCDFVTGCVHKVGGPRGIGFLKCPGSGRVEPLLRGGPQEAGRRAGTENVAGALSMVAALEARAGMMALAGKRLELRERFTTRLIGNLPGADLVGASQPRLWNTVASLLPEVECRQRWVVKLDKRGFAVSTGSACSSGSEQPSPVLLAMAYTPAEAARVLRFSSGWETSASDWDDLLTGLLDVARDLGLLRPA